MDMDSNGLRIANTHRGRPREATPKNNNLGCPRAALQRGGNDGVDRRTLAARILHTTAICMRRMQCCALCAVGKGAQRGSGHAVRRGGVEDAAKDIEGHEGLV